MSSKAISRLEKARSLVSCLPWWVRAFFRKSLNVIQWIPLIWADEDWDWVYLYKIMEFKLENMRGHISLSKNHEDWAVTAAQIEAARACLERLRKDEYVFDKWEEHLSKWPQRKATLEADGFYHLPPMDSAEAEEVRFLGEEEDRLQREDLKEFCRIFAGHSRDWWD